MHVEYQISEDDYVSAGQLFLKTRRRSSFYRRFVVPALWSVIIVSTIITVSVSEDWTAGLIICLVLLLVLVQLCRILIPWQLRRTYRKAPIYHVRRSLDIGEGTLHFSAPSSDSTTSWEPFIGFAENDRTFILVQQGNSVYYPISKGELTPTQVDELRSILETHLPRK
jgi:hypothetical protein